MRACQCICISLARADEKENIFCVSEFFRSDPRFECLSYGVKMLKSMKIVMEKFVCAIQDSGEEAEKNILSSKVKTHVSHCSDIDFSTAQC